MVNKKLGNVGALASNTDAATKKYVDENSSGGKTSLLKHHLMQMNRPQNNTQTVILFYRDGSHPMTGDVNKNNNKIENLPTPTTDGNAATKKYADDNKVDGSVFLKLDGTRKMTGNLDMNNKQINNLPLPIGSKQPTTLGFTDLKSGFP